MLLQGEQVDWISVQTMSNKLWVGAGLFLTELSVDARCLKAVVAIISVVIAGFIC